MGFFVCVFFFFGGGGVKYNGHMDGEQKQEQLFIVM